MARTSPSRLGGASCRAISVSSDSPHRTRPPGCRGRSSPTNRHEGAGIGRYHPGTMCHLRLLSLFVPGPMICLLAPRTQVRALLNHRRLLRSRGERPRGRAAEEGDEIATPHSITSSAATSSLSGTIRPGAFAVLKLRVVSYMV